MMKVGDKTPNFTLPNSKKEPVTLESMRGKNVVVAFFPGAFTGVCNKEACALRDALSAYNSLNATVVGISVDSPFANGAFAEHNHLGFPVLSDYKREVIRAYDVVHDDFAGLPGYTAAKRAVFVLDKEGTLRWSWTAPNPGVEPNYDDIKKAVESLTR